jgi:hypothetical protein
MKPTSAISGVLKSCINFANRVVLKDAEFDEIVDEGCTTNANDRHGRSNEMTIERKKGLMVISFLDQSLLIRRQ